jgi:hypothetical protein
VELRKTRDTKLGRKSTKLRKVERSVGGDKRILKSCDANEEEEEENILECN